MQRVAKLSPTIVGLSTACVAVAIGLALDVLGQRAFGAFMLGMTFGVLAASFFRAINAHRRAGRSHSPTRSR